MISFWISVVPPKIDRTVNTLPSGVDTLVRGGLPDAVGQVLIGDLKELLAKEAVQSELMPDNHVRHERPFAHRPR